MADYEKLFAPEEKKSRGERDEEFTLQIYNLLNEEPPNVAEAKRVLREKLDLLASVKVTGSWKAAKLAETIAASGLSADKLQNLQMAMQFTNLGAGKKNEKKKNFDKKKKKSSNNNQEPRGRSQSRKRDSTPSKKESGK